MVQQVTLLRMVGMASRERGVEQMEWRSGGREHRTPGRREGGGSEAQEREGSAKGRWKNKKRK